MSVNEQDEVDVREHLVTLAIEHLEEAHGTLVEAAQVMDRDHTTLQPPDLVELAHVHARIAHAAAALAMIAPQEATTREQLDAEAAPGLAALERLSVAVERLAGAPKQAVDNV